ncbi:MAG: DUF2808 domain-containing protein [Cyanobacteria bacterium J06626_23]
MKTILLSNLFLATCLGSAALAVSQLFALEAPDVNRIAEAATVRIEGQNPGSGVIFQKQGDTYFLLTAKHVVATEDEYEVVTPDSAVYPLEYSRVHKMPDMDLAVAEFRSVQDYPIAELGDSSQVRIGDEIFIAGWPHAGQALPYLYQFVSGAISGLPPQPLPGGYGLVYDSTTRQGMSGGPVLDDEGKVIGIHGRTEGKEIYLPDANFDSAVVEDDFGLGIPVNPFLQKAEQLPLRTENLPSPPEQTGPISYFRAPPRIVETHRSSSLQFRSADYFFTIDIPDSAATALEQVTFSQIEGPDYPSFSMRRSYAFIGSRGDRGEPLTLGLLANDTSERTISVVFSPPIEPGQQVTVALHAHRNPRDGIYLYEIQAFPPGGTAARAQRLGIERLDFYEPATFER